jgi:hypothetical protein
MLRMVRRSQGVATAMSTYPAVMLVDVLSRTAYLIDGVRLEEEMSLPPLRLLPVDLDRGYPGSELREIFNAELAAAGLVTLIEPSGWAVQFAPRHRLVLALTAPLDVGETLAGGSLASAVVGSLADLLALSHGGAPSVVAGVEEISEDGQHWRTLAVMAGRGPWPGNSLEKLPGSADHVRPLDIAGLWNEQLFADSQALFWLSLHRGIAAEPRWDVRIFRVCSLLETVGRELVERLTPVVDPDGQLLSDYNGESATAKHLRGLVYVLLQRSLDALSIPESALCAHPSRGLWDEIGIWADIRNVVAHEGRWSPAPALATDRRQRRVAEAFELAARGDGMESGWLRYEQACAAGAEVVLRATLIRRNRL